MQNYWASIYYGVFGGILILLLALPDAALPYPEVRLVNIIGCVLGILLVIRTDKQLTEAGKTASDPTPEAKKEDPGEYTWAEYIADIERGMSIDAMREKLAGRPVPTRPVAGPPPTPPDDEEDEYNEDPEWAARVDEQRFPGVNVPDPDAFSKTCYLCGKGLSSDKDDYCRSCRAIRLRAPKIAAEMRRRRYRDLDKIKVEREHALLDGLPVPVKCKCGVPLPDGGSHCSVVCFQQSLKPENPKTEKNDYIFRMSHLIPSYISCQTVVFCIPYPCTFELTSLDIIFPADLPGGVLNVCMGELNVEVVADDRVVLPEIPFSMFEKHGPRHGRWAFRNPFTTIPTGVLKVNLLINRPLPNSFSPEVLASGTLERPKS